MNTPSQVELIITSSLHEATLLGTVGVAPYKIARGPELTQAGTKKIKWIYNCDRKAEEAIGFWRSSDKLPNLDWKDMTLREKQLVISYTSAFAANLKHFVAHTKDS